MGSAQLDALDYAIVYRLQEDGRRALTEIADDLEVADNTVRNRIKGLEEAGVITGYQATVDYDVADVQHHYAFTCTARVSKREQLARRARDHADVTEVITLMTGTDNVIIVGAGRRKGDISRLARGLDELGLTIEREHLVWSHERQPYSGFRLEENL